MKVTTVGCGPLCPAEHQAVAFWGWGSVVSSEQLFHLWETLHRQEDRSEQVKSKLINRETWTAMERARF